MKTPKLVGLIFSIVGICLLIGDLFAYRSTAEFLNNSEKTTGIVTGLKQRRSSGSRSSSTLYAPVVKYKTVGAGEFEFTSSTASSPPAYSIGESVEVMYDKRDPASAEINSFFSLWLAVSVLTFLGVVFSGIGTLLLRIKE